MLHVKMLHEDVYTLKIKLFDLPISLWRYTLEFWAGLWSFYFDIDITDNDLWKYVDDTTIAEPLHKWQTSKIQSAVDK